MTGPLVVEPGRVYGTEWSLENVARLLRFQAERGFLLGRDLREDTAYRKACSARHLPSNTSIIFTRDAVPGSVFGWHASVCFVGVDAYLPWNEATAERWLVELYGPDDRAKVRLYAAISESGKAKGVRHFILEVAQW